MSFAFSENTLNYHKSYVLLWAFNIKVLWLLSLTLQHFVIFFVISYRTKKPNLLLTDTVIRLHDLYLPIILL